MAPLRGGDGAASSDVELLLEHTIEDEGKLVVSQEDSAAPPP